MVILSRIFLASPGMILTPIAMNYLELRGTLCRYPWINLPTQVVMVGTIAFFAVPMGCAFFKQEATIPASRIDSSIREKLKPNQILTYNKGL